MANTTLDSDIGTRTVRKVARRLIPFLGLLYFINYLDRTNIGFAKLTMSGDLGLTETMFGLAAGVFFIGYLVLEVPSNLALHRFGARRWIARIMVTWGLCAVAMAFVSSAGWLYAVRILLGAAEAGFFPGVMLYLTWWLPRNQRVRLIGAFLVAIPISSAVGAPVSAAIIQYADGFLGLEGWRVMFLLEGLPAIALGICCWFYLTDRPSEATWLAADEREWLTATMQAEHQAQAATSLTSVWHALASGRVLALGLVYFGIVYGLYALTFFLPTVVAGFAETFNTSFSILQTGLIVAVPFALGAIAMIFWSRHSDRTGERIWHVVIPVTLGGLAIPAALYMTSPFAVMVAITTTAVGVFCALPVFWYLPSAFLSGAGAAAGIALINSLGNTSGFAAPYLTGWLTDATGSFKAGLWLVGLAMISAAVGLALLGAASRKDAPPIKTDRELLSESAATR